MKWNILVGSLVLSLGLSAQSFGGNLLDRMLGMNYNGGCDTASCCETSICDADPSCGLESGCDSCAPHAKKCRKTPLLDLLRGCGKKKSCCDTGCSEPVCGHEDPCCGHEDPCEASCGVEDPCSSGCDSCGGCKKKCRRPLLGLLKNLRKSKHRSCDSCCETSCGHEDPCEASCGVEDPCSTGCDSCGSCSGKKRFRVSLLDRIFGRRCKKSSCCEASCGLESPCEASCGCEDPCEASCGCESGYGYESTAPAAADEPTEADDSDDEVGPAPVVDPSAFLPTQRRFIQTNLVR